MPLCMLQGQVPTTVIACRSCWGTATETGCKLKAKDKHPRCFMIGKSFSCLFIRHRYGILAVDVRGGMKMNFRVEVDRGFHCLIVPPTFSMAAILPSKRWIDWSACEATIGLCVAIMNVLPVCARK